MTLKVARFLEANMRSPVVYGGVGPEGVVYRLADNSTWLLTRKEAQLIGHPRWEHLSEGSLAENV